MKKITALFLKPKTRVPRPSSLRPPIFNSERIWFMMLGLCGAVLLAMVFIGGKMFYSQYFESYKKSGSLEDFENLINVKDLVGAIEQRQNLLDQEIPVSPNPSL